MNVNKTMTAEDVLAQMRAMRSAAQKNSQVNPAKDLELNPSSQINPTDSVNKPAFENVLSDALSSVNSLQKTSADLSERLTLGDDSVTLAETMIASQKAGVAFQATMKVRNKLVEAYKEVMNMPV